MSCILLRTAREAECKPPARRFWKDLDDNCLPKAAIFVEVRYHTPWFWRKSALKFVPGGVLHVVAFSAEKYIFQKNIYSFFRKIYTQWTKNQREHQQKKWPLKRCTWYDYPEYLELVRLQRTTIKNGTIKNGVESFLCRNDH